MEDIQDSVEEEVAPLESDNEPQAEVQPEEIERQKRQERNWSAARQRQKELELALKQRDELLAQLLKNGQPQQQAQAEPEEELDPEDYANYGGVKKVASKAVKPLEDKIKYLETRLEQQETQKRLDSLRAKFPDFDDVVNVETLELFEKNEPELAKHIEDMKDPYKMSLNCYKYIKALGLTEQAPAARRAKEVDKKIERSNKSVQTPQAYDKRPMAQAFKSTAAESKRLYEEMMYYASKANGL